MLDISHESLIRNWSQLNQWAREEAANARQYGRLHQDRQYRDDGQLTWLTGAMLQNLTEWRNREHVNYWWASRYHPEVQPLHDWDQHKDAFKRNMEFLEGSELHEKNRVEEELKKIQEVERLRVEAESAKKEASLRQAAENAQKEAEIQRDAAKKAHQEAEAEKQKAQEALVQAEEARRRATLFARGASLLAVLAVLLTVYAYNQQREAKLAQQNAELQGIRADSSARLAAEQRDIARIEKLKADSSAILAFEQKQLAEQKSREAEINLGIAKREEARVLVALEQVKKEKNATEEQRQRAEDNYAKAQKATDEAERNLESLKKANEAGVRALLQNAEENMKDKRCREALNKINSAFGLGVLFDTVRAAYVKNIDASLEDGQLTVALETAQSAFDKGLVSTEMLANTCLRVARGGILNMHYDTALLATRLAVRSGVSAAEASSLYFELSYWHCETGSLEQSSGLLDTAYQLSGRRLFLSGTDTAMLHGAMRKFDLQRYEFLHHRYYPKMVNIPGGTFSMGGPDSDTLSDESERPVHRVTLSSYSMSATEVTVFQFGLYCALSGKKGIRNYIEWPNSGDHPVVNVSWYDAVEYSNWLSERRGKRRVITGNKTDGYTMQSGVIGYRLPTESEWEYAARGGSKSKGSVYAGGDSLALVGWCRENSGGRTHPVGEKMANELGLYDMSGNVWEWCWDWYGEYKKDALENPKGAEKGAYRVYRGGGWGSVPRYCRAANRNYGGPSDRYSYLGFRLVSSLQ
jgi:formylglycine-generating enzyme required for sulfatase activity